MPIVGSNSKIMLKSYFFLNINKYEIYNTHYESTCELKILCAKIINVARKFAGRKDLIRTISDY